MITGFNTDIEHDGVIYHVQTEDKGVETPLILSLVYDRGTILASKRTLYDDLMQSGFDEKVLAERLQKQHKLICAAVRAGRIEELKKMTAKDAALKKEAKLSNGHAPLVTPPQTDIKPEVRNIQPPQYLPNNANFANAPAAAQELKPQIQTEVKEDFAPAIPQPKETFVPAIPQPKEELIWDLPLEIIDEDFIVDVGNIIEAETILSADAVEIFTGTDNLAKAKKDSLEIEFLNETAFKAGERKTLNIRVFRGISTNFISEAQVMVKVLGSSFRPLIFHAKTNETGVAVVHLQLPQFRSGRGAILVRAISDGEEAELRQIVRQA
ncbi:MAG TPA: hypothetical protein VNB22_23835 [Pyrinomonadaceae bacterium]|nr:hypothetical protein [Pyrinomonadaceae bacterium]